MGSYERTGNKYKNDIITPLQFGKYKGKCLGDIIKRDPQWVKWALDNVDWFDISKKAKKLLDSELTFIEDNIDPELEEAFRDAYGPWGD